MKKLKDRACTQERMQSSRYRNIIRPMSFEDEKFVQISKFIPAVKDYYWISNYGRIYSSFVDASIMQDLARGCTHTTFRKKDGTSQIYDLRDIYYQAFGKYYD